MSRCFRHMKELLEGGWGYDPLLARWGCKSKLLVKGRLLFQLFQPVRIEPGGMGFL